MERDNGEKCPHLQGLRAVEGSWYRCPACEARLDLDGISRWVREAERARDGAYSAVEDEFSGVQREERQAEVYRRRRVLYEVQHVPRHAVARPEMMLVVFEPAENRYECRIFYKAPRPAWGVESFMVGATGEDIRELGSDDNPTVRLASGKVAEFHEARSRLVDAGVPAPPRRVFYANEL